MTKNTLFSPTTFGALNLKNRIVMAPMTRNRATQAGVPQPIMATYYEQRASAGLIISEATQVCREGQGYPCTPGIFTPEQAAGWKAVTSAVHEKGGSIVLQLWHCGRISHSSYQPNGTPPPAPSPIACKKGEVMTYEGPKPFETPQEIQLSEIPSIISAYRSAAKLAIEAGFDGVEVHGANGYLIDQFLRDGSNKRTDSYGGSPQNRARLLLEIVDAICAEISPQRVGVRISPNGSFNDMSDSDPIATYSHVCQELSKRSIAYLHYIERMQGDPEVKVSLTHVRAWFTGNLVVNGGFTKDRATEVLAENQADAVAIGVPFISNPDLVERFAQDAPLNQPDLATFYGGDHHGYTDYPTLG